MSDPKNVRLYCILARESPRAVIFRRGPTKQVMLAAWDTRTDEIEEGQWLKGRLYERRCDLSPDGKLLIYFGGNQKPPFGTWTAISKPPFLTALALWPKGDAWGGGGHFVTRARVRLNHWSNQMELADGFSIPKWLHIEPFGFRSGSGEDNPIWFERLTRDGWKIVNERVLEKQHPTRRYTLRMTLRDMMERGGPWYVIDYDVTDEVADDVHVLERTDWADWSNAGDLLFARRGSVYRMKSTPYGLGEPSLVIDLADRKFVNREAPREATRWPAGGRRTSRRDGGAPP